MASTASATTIDPSDSVGGVERRSQSTMTVTAAIVTFDEEDTAVVTENDQHAAADNDHHAPEDADMDTDVSEGPVVTESMTDQCGQTFTSHDPKARTFQGHRWHRLGAMPTDPVFLRHGVYSMDVEGVECQNVDTATMKRLLGRFRRGTLRMAHLEADDTDNDDDTDRATPSEGDAEEDTFFLAKIALRPDGMVSVDGEIIGELHGSIDVAG